ncbi:MAG: C10 family peptidase [Bacteroidales bacterium]|nr:C10 family peptidase [Bacteroidales bacterium]
MKKLTFLSLLIFTISPFLLMSQTINRQKIAEYAATAFSQRNHSPSKNQFSVKTIDYLIENGDTLMGIVNFSPKGFIIMGMNEKTTPIWAYSTENNFIVEEAPDGAFTLIDAYKGIILADIAKETAEQKTVQAWEQITMKTRSTKDNTPIVGPLITATWNQDKYYNQLSPMDSDSPTGYDGRVPNGCVALAMAMIMYYYRYPETGTGSHTNHTGYGNFTVNFAQQTYNYNAMQDQLSGYNNEVAKLIFHCATSVDMDYAPDGSGAQSHDAANAFKDYFKYSSSLSYKNKRDYSDKEWNTLLINNLNQGRPLYYSGYSESGGHAFVCDGYNNDTLFHFNFGWGGAGNGYYTVTDTSTSTGGYSGWQSAIFNLYPDNNYPNYCNGTTVVTASSGTLEDGSNNESYANNSHCTYIIAPPKASVFNITVDQLKTEANNDKLVFWKGNPANNQLHRTLSGNEKNLSFTVQTDTLYITFETNSDTTDEGWRISYTVDRNVDACNGYSVITNHSGIQSDGSENGGNYAPQSECTWLIRPSTTTGVTYNGITFTFNYFDLSPEDQLIFYNAEGVAEIVNIFNGSAPPPTTITYPYTKMRVDFKSDNYLEKAGFEFQWATTLDGTSIASIEKGKIELYPNPASNYVTIVLGDNQSGAQLAVMDITGKTIFSDLIPAGELQYQLNTSDIPSGMYIVKMTNSKSVMTGKLIIEK